MPELDETGLRPAQIDDAVKGVERALREQHYSRSLVQMATGAGKTYTAVTEAYRLLKWGGFTRILFLVDRNNLADLTLGEFQNYRTPDDGRRFTELYNVAKLTRGGMPDSTVVAISTIHRVFKAIKNEDVPQGDDPNLDDFTPDAPVEVAYNPDLPSEAFDLVIVDEAHRSIYGVWRRVLEYFDAHVVGLTATPGKQTFGFFQQNLVSEYTYPQSVADGVNVDFDIYRISTEITENGSTIEAGTLVPKVDRRTREQRLEALDADLDYTKTHLRLESVTPIRVAPAKARALELKPGDVLLNEGGDRDRLARGWVWEGQIPKCIHQNHVFRARVHEPRLDPYFLSWTANTFGGRWAERNGKQSVNLASISLSMIRRMPVIVPCEGESSRVVARLREQTASFDRLQREVEAAKARSAALRRALLAAAFSGRLTGSSRDLSVVEDMIGG